MNSFEARSSGTLVRVLAEVGDELPVGQLIGVIAAEAVTDAAIEAFIVAQTSGAVSEPTAESPAATTDASSAGEKCRVCTHCASLAPKA